MQLLHNDDVASIDEPIGPVAIAKLCHVAPETVYRWIQEGKLPSFKTAGGHSRVFKEDVEIFLGKLNLSSVGKGVVQARVLVVDDEPPVRRLVVRVVQQVLPRSEIVEAGDGFEAGRQTVLMKPHLVILDLHLPGMDGFRVCQAIRDDAGLKSPKILAITGDPTPEARRKILDAGADDFMEKPLDVEVLKAKIGALVGAATGGSPRGTP